MKRLSTFIYILICLTLSSCVKEQLDPISVLEEGEGWLSFSFGAENAIEVSTKATQDLQTESLIQNFYIFIFEQGGDPSNNDKVYGHFFDANNMTTSGAFGSRTDDCWYITYPNTANGTASGKVKLKASAGSGRTMYMLTNLDSDMVRISSDLLANTIKTEQDLLDFNVFLNQPIIYRNSHFPMSGKMTGVSIVSESLTANESSMKLKRLDAKVKFIFQKGTPVSGQTIKSFEARKWKVVNVPRTAFAIEQARDHGQVTSADVSTYSTEAVNFFDTDFVNFEEYKQIAGTPDITSEFSFYMLENRQQPKDPDFSEYQDRSRQLKDKDTGMNQSCHVEYFLNGKPYSRDMKLFANANDFSTYVLVTGYMEMELDNDSAGQILGSDVQYLIHLGDWSDNINNFSTERNTSYTYTVTVRGVNNIRVEVETSKGGPSDVVEGQPGATGNVTIAKEDIALCDAHYVSKTLSFHLVNFFEGGIIDEDNCVVDKMTWRVKTPFSEGSPQNIGGIDVTEGLDYDWVRFRLNKQDAGGNYYADERRKFTPRVFESSTTMRSASDNLEGDGTPGLAGYHNDGSMDIVALVEYMRKQVKLWMQNPEATDFDHKDATDDEIRNPNFDDHHADKSPKICVTVFVDEYYYSEHPLTHSAENPTLWKHFINADDREMQILCNSDASKDLESRATGSVVTIKQKSIKTIYNDDPDYTALNTAWGFENEDEFNGKWTYWSQVSGGERGNTDSYNGLLNTCKEWELYDTSADLFKDGSSWGTYMDFEVNNDTPQLRGGSPDYNYLRYSCMTRNRDNDGNGAIDRDEVRWYMASVRQLIGLYIGENVVDKSTRLYNRTPAQMASGDEGVWQQHVVSSTASAANASNLPTIIWAEEGISTGPYKTSDANTKLTVRCVRNLGDVGGNIAATGKPEAYRLDQIPDDYIVKEKGTGDDSHVFTTTHLNKDALRYYTSRELPFADQNSVENRLYKKFAVYKEGTTSGDGVNVTAFNNNVTNDISNGQKNRYCPEGYRTPNQRELAIMVYYFSNEADYTLDEIDANYITRTYWSFGSLGSGKSTKDGFAARTTPLITVNSTTHNGTRCVRDIRTD